MASYFPERVQRGERGEPKAPPAGIQPPRKTLQQMTLQELREVVRVEEAREQRHQAGYYVAPIIPTIQQYGDRIQELEEQERERNRLAALEAEQQRLATLRREREAKEAEDLRCEAASTEVPAEQISQMEVPQVPAIGVNTAVHSVSSTEQSSSTGGETERRDSEGYWENIVDCMFDYFNDENDITHAVSLHEGVLFWMTLEEVERLQNRAKSGNDPEAKGEYENYNTDKAKLEIQIQQDYEVDYGKIEDVEEFKTALAAKEDGILRTLIYQYAQDLRERISTKSTMERSKDDRGREEEGEVQTRHSTRTSRRRGEAKQEETERTRST
eukprot:6436275-Amphidinium_carterae.6